MTDQPQQPPKISSGDSRSGLFIAAVGLGITAITTQTILAREALSAAAGHELMFGLVLFGWLAGQAMCVPLIWRLGDRLGLLGALLVAALSVPASYILLRLVLLQVTPVDGTTAPVLAVAPVVLACTLPAGLGLALAFSAIYHQARKSKYHDALLWIYAAETAGFLAGGLLWTFALAGHIAHLQIVMLIPAVLLLGSVFAFRDGPRRSTVILALVLVPIAILTGQLLRYRLEPALPMDIPCIETNDGLHSRWQVGEYSGEYSFYGNGQLIGSTGNPGIAQEHALLPLSQLDAEPGQSVNLLWIGQRYPGVDSVIMNCELVNATWLENDQQYAALYEEYAGTSPLGSTATGSPQSKVGRPPDDGWDLIVINLGPPTSASISWAFQPEFLELCRENMTEQGVLALALEAEANYNSPALLAMHNGVLANLSSAYTEILITPPVPVWYFAGTASSNLTLDPVEIETRLAGLGFTSSFMSRYVLMDRLAADRAAGWSLNADLSSPDTSLQLAGLRASVLGTDTGIARLLDWLNDYKTILAITLGLLLLLPLVFSWNSQPAPHDEDLGVSPHSVLPFSPQAIAYLCGFTCLSGEVLLAWKLQAISGLLYSQLALLTAAVLGGLFIGTLLSRIVDGWWVPRLTAGPVGIAVTLGCIALLASSASISPVHYISLWLLALSLPIACGIVLGQALSSAGERVGMIYAADLLGSALGALAIGTIGLFIWNSAGIALALAIGWLGLWAVGVIRHKLWRRHAATH